MAKSSGGTRSASWRDSIDKRANPIGSYETTRLQIKETTNETRSFFDAYPKPTGDFWTDAFNKPDKEVASLTVDRFDDGSIHLNQLNAWRSNQGYGSELLKTVLQRFKAQGVQKATCYVEWSNSDPLKLIKTLGFKETGKETTGGRYFQIKLKDLK